ncbi:hypothetical protein EG329_003676 [Mollisiaceae sp. DMI_Dod_QoI]|nr:hypothetical protein EG329_003676 [Helotiales sp. DMI_Dod_QoI]
MPTKPKRRKNAARPALRPQPLTHRPHPQTELNVEHSTQLVQTAVAAIFFEIIWVRKVFQDHAWQHRNYHPDDPSNSYDAYVTGTDFKLPFPNEIYDWHVPKRGEDERVDKLMDCLACYNSPLQDQANKLSRFSKAQQESSIEVNAPPYTQYILDHLNKRLFERAVAGKGDDFDEPQGTGHDNDHFVSCECECQGDSGNMLYCVECQQLQHSVCYGYLDDQQFSNHFCYTCLSNLYPEEKRQLIDAASLCVQRLTLRFLQDKHVPVSLQKLADYLGRSLELTGEVIEALERTKLVRKFNAIEELSHQQVKYVGNDKALREIYFRPQRFINNLFAIPEASLSNSILKPENATGRNGAACSINNASIVVDPSQRPFYDDSTTQGEPSPQSSTHQTSQPLDTYHLQNIARTSLEFNPKENVTPVTKRSVEVGSPVGAVKRVRTSRTSPMLF